MATSIFHGITKSYGRTFCGRLDAYMIIIYTTAKTPQTLTRLSLSLFLSPLLISFSYPACNILSAHFPSSFLPPANTTTRTTRTAAATFVFVPVFLPHRWNSSTATPSASCVYYTKLFTKGKQGILAFFLTKKAGEPVDFEWTQK